MDKEVAGNLGVDCKEEESESRLSKERDLKSSSKGSTSGGLVLLGNNNDVAAAAEAFAKEMLEMGKKKEMVVDIEDSRVAEKTKEREKNENAGPALKYQRAPSIENSEIEFVEICPAPSPVEFVRANTEKGKMYGGLDGDGSKDEDKGRPKNNVAIQVISSDVVTHRSVSLDVIEQQGEEDIVTPTLSLLMFNIIMPCLDIYFDTLLIQKLSPDHLGCLLVIVCALTVNFSFTCLAWWRFEL